MRKIFQGQEAPGVIYSMSTSSPEDAPRGMEFLYSFKQVKRCRIKSQKCIHTCGQSKVVSTELQQPKPDEVSQCFCRCMELVEKL